MDSSAGADNYCISEKKKKKKDILDKLGHYPWTHEVVVMAVDGWKTEVVGNGCDQSWDLGNFVHICAATMHY